jgi:hypothetical protein
MNDQNSTLDSNPSGSPTMLPDFTSIEISLNRVPGKMGLKWESSAAEGTVTLAVGYPPQPKQVPSSGADLIPLPNSKTPTRVILAAGSDEAKTVIPFVLPGGTLTEKIVNYLLITNDAGLTQPQATVHVEWSMMQSTDLGQPWLAVSRYPGDAPQAFDKLQGSFDFVNQGIWYVSMTGHYFNAICINGYPYSSEWEGEWITCQGF